MVTHPKGVRIENLGRGHLTVTLGIGGRGFGVDQQAVGKEHILCSEGRPIVPAYTLAQMKGQGQIVRRDFPALGQFPFNVEILVVAHQAVIDQTINIA